jgi:hypothetical protein
VSGCYGESRTTLPRRVEQGSGDAIPMESLSDTERAKLDEDYSVCRCELTRLKRMARGKGESGRGSTNVEER